MSLKILELHYIISLCIFFFLIPFFLLPSHFLPSSFLFFPPSTSLILEFSREVSERGQLSLLIAMLPKKLSGSI